MARLTVVIDDELKKEFKSEVSMEGTDLKTKVIELVTKYLESKKDAMLDVR
jgi:hypothetical protein